MIAFKQEELQLLPNQGHCNLNYLLEKEGKKYLVRKFRLADRDRALEFKIQKLAHKKGIGAKPLYLDEAIMIGEFAEGVHKKRLSRKETRVLARSLKKLHKIPFHAKRTNLTREIKDRKIVTQLKRFRKEFTLVHGDLNSKNILFSDKVTLIDWEYAGYHDRYFDLATVCEEFVLDEAYFLRAYGGRVSFKKLSLYKKIYAILYRQWFLKLQKGQHPFL